MFKLTKKKQRSNKNKHLQYAKCKIIQQIIIIKLIIMA